MSTGWLSDGQRRAAIEAAKEAMSDDLIDDDAEYTEQIRQLADGDLVTVERRELAELVKAARAAAVKLRDNQASGSERRMAVDDLAEALKPFTREA
jgi:hypothetical protein